jgi:hypothetical protein
VKSNKFKLSVFFCIILPAICIQNLYGQDKSVYSLSTNVFGFAFNDFSIYLHATDEKRIKKSISVGFMIASRWWNAETGSTGDIEVNDDKYPIGSYNGPQLRIGYFAGRSKNDKIRYKGPQLIFKYIYYKNETFIDWFSHDDAVSVSYTRSEKAYVIGLEWVFQKEKPHRDFFINTFWSLGLRMKFREITTSSVKGWGISNAYASERPVGFKKTTLFIPTINFGVMLGSKIH